MGITWTLRAGKTIVASTKLFDQLRISRFKIFLDYVNQPQADPQFWRCMVKKKELCFPIRLAKSLQNDNIHFELSNLIM